MSVYLLDATLVFHELPVYGHSIPDMLHVRQKRASKGVAFPKPEAKASSSKSASIPATSQPSKPATKSAQARYVRNASAPTLTRASQQASKAPAKVSNRQRRLASLFMALMASSPLPIETDAETLEAAQKDSIAPKSRPGTSPRCQVSTILVQEVRAGRWRKFRYELSLKTRRKGKIRKCEDVELDDLVELRGADRKKGDDMA